MTTRRLLWADDEGPDRFLFAAHRLRAAGWEIVWVTTVGEAAERLRHQRFDAALFDQMMPMVSGLAPSVWSGCTLFRWLRGLPRHPAAPPSLLPPDGAPSEANVRVPVLIISAYADADVEAAMIDGLDDDLVPRWANKPIDPTALVDDLDHTVPV